MRKEDLCVVETVTEPADATYTLLTLWLKSNLLHQQDCVIHPCITYAHEQATIAQLRLDVRLFHRLH